MSTEYPTSFVLEYASGVTHLAQQDNTRLLSAVRSESIASEREAFDQIAATSLQRKQARHGDSPQVDVPHRRRWVTTDFFETGDYIDKPDMIRSLNDFANPYVQSFAKAAGRTIDDEIIASFFATATVGDGTASGTTTAAFPTATHQFGTGSGMTLAKLLQAREILDSFENDDDYFIAVSARQIRDLLSDTTITSADFNTVKALVAGEINQFVGFTFIRTERLDTNGSSERRVPVWSRNSVLAALGQNPSGRITERADKSFSTYAYYSLDVGATRMDETGVVEIQCTEA